MVDIMQVVKFLECLGLLIKDLTQTTEMKQTKKKWISWYDKLARLWVNKFKIRYKQDYGETSLR